MSVKLRYVGPHAEVEVEDIASGDLFIVQSGELHEFPSEFAERLLEQPANWRRTGVEISDAAEQLATEHGINVNDLKGSGSKGTITVGDVEAEIGERDGDGQDLSAVEAELDTDDTDEED